MSRNTNNIGLEHIWIRWEKWHGVIFWRGGPRIWSWWRPDPLQSLRWMPPHVQSVTQAKSGISLHPALLLPHEHTFRRSEKIVGCIWTDWSGNKLCTYRLSVCRSPHAHNAFCNQCFWKSKQNVHHWKVSVFEAFSENRIQKVSNYVEHIFSCHQTEKRGIWEVLNSGVPHLRDIWGQILCLSTGDLKVERLVKLNFLEVTFPKTVSLKLKFASYG